MRRHMTCGHRRYRVGSRVAFYLVLPAFLFASILQADTARATDPFQHWHKDRLFKIVVTQKDEVDKCDDEEYLSIGTGFLVGPPTRRAEWYVVTARHVVDDGDTIRELAEDCTFAFVIGSSGALSKRRMDVLQTTEGTHRDIALLRFRKDDALSETARPYSLWLEARFPETETRWTKELIGLGFPLKAAQQQGAQGVPSIQPDIRLNPNCHIQTQCTPDGVKPIEHGFSGGPVIMKDATGEPIVVGMMSKEFGVQPIMAIRTQLESWRETAFKKEALLEKKPVWVLIITSSDVLKDFNTTSTSEYKNPCNADEGAINYYNTVVALGIKEGKANTPILIKRVLESYHEDSEQLVAVACGFVDSDPSEPDEGSSVFYLKEYFDGNEYTGSDSTKTLNDYFAKNSSIVPVMQRLSIEKFGHEEIWNAKHGYLLIVELDAPASNSLTRLKWRLYDHRIENSMATGLSTKEYADSIKSIRAAKKNSISFFSEGSIPGFMAQNTIVKAISSKNYINSNDKQIYGQEWKVLDLLMQITVESNLEWLPKPTLFASCFNFALPAIETYFANHDAMLDDEDMASVLTEFDKRMNDLPESIVTSIKERIPGLKRFIDVRGLKHDQHANTCPTLTKFALDENLEQVQKKYSTMRHSAVHKNWGGTFEPAKATGYSLFGNIEGLWDLGGNHNGQDADLRIDMTVVKKTNSEFQQKDESVMPQKQIGTMQIAKEFDPAAAADVIVFRMFCGLKKLKIVKEENVQLLHRYLVNDGLPETLGNCDG